MKMDEVVSCPKCGGKELYGNMHWLNGETMCRKCIEDVWRKKELDKKENESGKRINGI